MAYITSGLKDFIIFFDTYCVSLIDNKPFYDIDIKDVKDAVPEQAAEMTIILEDKIQSKEVMAAA